MKTGLLSKTEAMTTFLGISSPWRYRHHLYQLDKELVAGLPVGQLCLYAQLNSPREHPMILPRPIAAPLASQQQDSYGQASPPPLHWTLNLQLQLCPTNTTIHSSISSPWRHKHHLHQLDPEQLPEEQTPPTLVGERDG